MGYYIPGPAKGKAEILVEKHGAVVLPASEVRAAFDEAALVCVVDNGPFEAAGFCYSLAELIEFTRPDDFRPKTFLRMDRDIAQQLSGFE